MPVKQVSEDVLQKIADDTEPSFVVHASRVLEEGSTADIGSLIKLEPIEVGKPMPLRGVSYGVDTVRAMLQGKLNPDLPIYALRHKGKHYVMTLADMRLVLKGE